VAGFDSDDTSLPICENEKMVYPMEMLSKICSLVKITIGIIAVPESEAQKVCNILVENGINVIWNFASVHLVTPENVFVKNENMAISLAILSRSLRAKEIN